MPLKTPIYLDHHATTPLDPRVLAVMHETLARHFGNPASATHAYGWAAARLVEEARERVAGLIGATPREIVFTAGATESNNLALKGFAAARGAPGHIVTTALEHEAVAEPLAELAAAGWRVTAVPPDRDGIVAPEAVAEALRPDTALVSVIAAQNEIGTLQPLARIGELCKSCGVVLHTDAAQAAGHVPLDVAADGLDLVSISGHKMYGPKGVGALFVRRRDPRVMLAPLVTGGGQERGLRAGTLDVPAIVAFGEACRLAGEEMPAEAARLGALARRLYEGVAGRLTGVRLNGDAHRRLPGSLNLSFEGVPAHRLLAAMPTLAVSSGSACASEEPRPSAVLAAIGVSRELALASVRIGIGRFTTPEEIDHATAVIVAAVSRLREEGRQARLAAPPVA